MEYIKKTIASWEIKYGQIALTGDLYQKSISIFKDLIGNTFDIKTFKGIYKNKHFIHYPDKNSLRLACGPFFKKLKEGDTFYLYPKSNSTIEISKTEPKEDNKEIIDEFSLKKKTDNKEILELLVSLIKENRQLKEFNNELLIYKERIEKFNNLDYIFEDEKFMEDWLERNIHKAVPNLDIIDRQPIIKWKKEAFLRNRPDFFCIDRTTKELVVVENKVRGRNRTIETQYLTYKAWVKNNIELINKTYEDYGLKATSKFRFVIITDKTDEKLEAICEDNDIALVLIDGGVIFEQIFPY